MDACDTIALCSSASPSPIVKVETLYTLTVTGRFHPSFRTSYPIYRPDLHQLLPLLFDRLVALGQYLPVEIEACYAYQSEGQADTYADIWAER